MSLVNFNCVGAAGNFVKPQAPKASSESKPSIFTPSASVETAGSIASSAPVSGSSFSASC